jgi:Na+/H+-dicarboxylate symporter
MRNSCLETPVAKRLTLYILAAMILGIVVGITLNRTISDPTTLTNVTSHISILTDLFLRLIKMIIAPLVFATLVTGIAHMGDTAALGRVGFRSIAWFLCASLLSLTLGLVMVNLLQPGVGADLVLPPAGATAGLAQTEFSLQQFITHLVPKSFFEAMANNEILQIVVFSVFTGVAITAVGERAAPLVRGIEALVQVMLQITDYVMRFAPFAVFAAVTTALAEQGPGILLSFGKFMGSFYLSMVLLWIVLLTLCWLIVGGRSKLLIRYIREPILLAFSTASSEAAFPRTLEALDRFGVPPRIASFVLPLGYSFNLDGSMIYCTFATMFIAQAYGIELTFAHQVTMLLILMVTSKGIAGVPRASLVIISSTLAFFDIPEAGLLLILAVDHFLDMGRSATNVVGNAVASVVIAKWEGTLDPLEPAEYEPPHAP